MGDKYFWRQVYIQMTCNLRSVSTGMMIAFPSLLSPALLSDTADIEVTPTQVYWIITINGIAGIFGFFILSPIMQIFGRKVVHIVDGLSLLIGWLMLALGTSAAALMAARICHGIDFGSLYISTTLVAEYSDPKRRGYFMTFHKLAIAIGYTMCHALSLIWNWRQVATCALLLSVLSTLMTYYWPESSYYLAMKGRFKESEKAFVWIYGSSNMEEFHLLKASQLQMKKKITPEKKYSFLFKKEFLKPCFIIFLLTLILEFSGKHYFAVYTIQIMVELIKDKSLAIYITLGSDSLTLIALLLSSVVISYFRRRTMLLAFGAVIIVMMLMISFIILFKLFSVVWLAPTLILVLNFITNISFTPVCFTLFGELYPLEHKGWGSCLNGVTHMSMFTLGLRLTPFLINTTGTGGLYGIYGVIISVCLLVLYFILPETKDKTLLEIENRFKGVVLSDCDESPMIKH